MLTVPGSSAWLLRHELRLWWRGVRGPLRKSILFLAFLALIWVIAHAFGYRAGQWLAAQPGLRPSDLGLGAMILGLVLVLALSGSLPAALEALYRRGDTDLLLTAPLPPRRILLMRALAIFVAALLWPALLGAPLIDGASLSAGPGMLMAWPMLVGTVLLATAVAILATLALVAALGIRRAGGVIGVLGVLTSLMIYPVTRAQSLFDTRSVPGLGAWLASGPLGWLARGIFGGGPQAVAMLVAGGAALLGVSTLAGRWFADGTLAALGQRAPARTARPAAFRAGFRVLLTKELRLLRRYPRLFQHLAQVAPVLFPLGFSFLARGRGFPAWLMTSAAVLLPVMVAAQLLIISAGEDALPDLIAGAPVPTRRIARAKWLAGVLPSLALALVLAGVLAVIGGWAVLPVLPCVLAGLAMEVWIATSLRRGAPSFVTQMASLLNALVWAGVAGAAGIGGLM